MSLDMLKAVCSLATAPFAEQRVIRFAQEFVAARPRLTIAADPYDNQLIELRGSSGDPRLVFTAHMDHPGFVAQRMIDQRTLLAHFRGYVRTEFFPKQKVRFFDEGRKIVGTVIRTAGHRKSRPVPTRAWLRVEAAVPRGTIGMWDLPAGSRRGKQFRSRACDDLAGAAAALAALDELSRRPPAGSIALLLTRAEEEGFIGAIAASKVKSLLRATDRLIAIECSAQQSFAPQGAGPIIRIGDRTSVFNSALSYFLTQEATRLAKRDRAFKYQRALMPGGTCEATAYDVYGFTAASICIALGNYHNMNLQSGRIEPEFIDVSDWQNMVRLFVAIARRADRFEPGHQALRERLEKRFAGRQRLLRKLEPAGA